MSSIENDHPFFSMGGQSHFSLMSQTSPFGLEGELFVLRLNVPVNNFSVMLGRSQHFLGLTGTVGC